MGQLSLRGIHKDYDGVQVIRGIDLDVHEGEFLVFVGPSGCGKSTLLRMIAGLETISAGDLLIDGQRANDLRPSDRGAAMVFQSYALYPHMTVADNMGFALRMAGVSRSERETKVRQAAEVLRITELLARYPKELSGGQRQRVAIGRAIVRQPKVFLFDEPLSNLDAALRVNTRIELSRLHRQLGTTMIYVTHDQVEAMTMGSRIAVFNQGHVEQVGAPLDLYNRPANRFVAGFLGAPRINFVDQPGAGASAAHRALWQALNTRTAGAPAHSLGLRPEHLHLAGNRAHAAGAAAGVGIPATVALCEHLGDTTIAYLQVDGLAELLHAKLPADQAPLAPGAPVALAPDAAWALAFDSAGRLI